MSPLTEAMIVNGVVLAATLEADLGRDRKLGWFRLLRTPVLLVAVVPLFAESPVTHGNGLLVELAGIAAGLACGLLASLLIGVHRSPRTGKPASSAGLPYALAWILLVGARAAFSWGAVHWFPLPLAQWCLAHQVSGAAITDGLIFMAAVLVLVRTGSLAARAARLAGRPAADQVPA